MALYFILCISIIFVYLLIIGWATNGWDATEEIRIPSDYKAKYRYTILVPFKDEANNIKECISSLLKQEDGSPHFEIIAIDDHSEDRGAKYIDGHPITLILNNGTGKKQAISTGLQRAQFEYIITVDADCLYHPKWLKLVDQHIQSESYDVVAAPIHIKEDDSLLTRFQYMDTAATMALTAAGIQTGRFYLSNGANFIYKKSAFIQVEGFKGNETYASGDDVFLMNKFEKAGYKIGYCKSMRASATTSPESSLGDFYSQRKRWATKTKGYANKNIIFIQGYLFVTAIIILINITIAPFIVGSFALITGIFMLFLKMIIDYLFLNKMTKFFKGKKIMKSFILANFLYLTYILMMGILALIPTTTTWKGRKI